MELFAKIANWRSVLSTTGNFTAFSHRGEVIIKLIIADIAMVELSLFCGFELRNWLAYSLALPRLEISQLAQPAVSILFLVPVTYSLFGLYPGYRLCAAERFRFRVIGAVLVFVALAIWDYIVQKNAWPRGIVISATLFASLLPAVFSHYFTKYLATTRSWGEPAVVIGPLPAVTRIIATLQANPGLGFQTVAAFSDVQEGSSDLLHGVPLRGSISEATAGYPRVDLAIVANELAKPGKPAEFLYHLPYSKLLILADVMGLQSLWVNTRDFDGSLALMVKRNLLLRRNRILKIVFDYCVSLPIIVLTAPLLGFLCIWIRSVDPGPAIFVQWREGRGGTRFYLYKLRTMYSDAELRLEHHLAKSPEAREEWETYVKLRDDPRILPGIGHFLRHTSMDELPQLWNIFLGQMSLVGPRPLPDYHIKQLSEDARKLRRIMKPGLTGLWQVSSRADGDIAVMERLDSYYINNWSPWLDITILLDTVNAVVSGKGAR